MDSEYLLLTGALRVFDDFSAKNSTDFFIRHDVKNPKHELLRNKYFLSETAGGKDDFSKAEKLMQWVYDNVLHCGGGAEADIQRDPISILDYSYGKGRMPGIYCRHQAVVFTECCLSIGLTARTLHCLPFSPNDFDTHVVSMVYVRKLNKWVLFDQGNTAYFKDKNGVPLSPLEARYGLSRDDIYVSDGLHREIKSYQAYMAKNLFYFKFWAVNTFGTDLVENQTTYYFVPSGFNVRERERAYYEYAVKNCPEEVRKGWEDAQNQFAGQHIEVVSQEQFESRNT